VGLDVAPPEPTEEAELPYQVTSQEDQPPSPKLRPQPKPVTRPTASPGPVIHPQELTITPSEDGIPWWVWGLVLLALSRKRR
jgi:hypothetical protein